MKARRIRIYIWIFMAACIGILCRSHTAFADDMSGYYLPADSSLLKTESAVNDFAGIYSPEQIQEFEKQMKTMQEEYDCNVVAFIIDNNEWNSSEQSAPERVSERFLPLDYHKSTVVLWLNINGTNRSLYLLGYGSAEYKIMDDEADEIAKYLQKYVVRQQDGEGVSNSLYIEMMNQFIKAADEEMRRPYFFLTWWFQLAVGVAIGLIVVLVMVHNIGGKMTASGNTYINSAFSKVIGRQDIYTHTTYVRTKRSSSSGGGGGGGRSHSSGGGRF